MNKYLQLKNKHQKEFNEFPIGFAFSDKQFKEQMEKLGLTENDTDKIVGIGAGGFIRKSDENAFISMINRRKKENKEAMKDDEFLYQSFRYELANHEFCITYDPEDTLESLDLTESDIENNPRVKKIFECAKYDYLKNCDNE